MFAIWHIFTNWVFPLHILVIFNEPLTFLQRVAEYMEYVHLLHTAASLDDPLHRLQVSYYLQ